MSQRSLEVYMENLLRRTSLETQSPVQNHMVLIVDDNARTPTDHHTPPSPLLQKAREYRSNDFLFDNGEPTLNGKSAPVLPWGCGTSSDMKEGTSPKGSKWSSTAAKFVCRPLSDIGMAPPQRRESSEITCTSVSETCEELWEGDEDDEGERPKTTLQHIAMAIDIASPDC